MTAAAEHERGHEPAAVQRADRRTTEVVSLQIGGNDIGFTEILQNCVTYNPFGRPCQNRYNPGGNDEIKARIDATAPKVAAVIQGIRAALADRAGPGRQLRGDPARRPAAAAGRRCRSRYADVPYLRSEAEGAQRDARSSRRPANGATLRRRLHGVASAGTRAGPPARAGSSRWCRATPPRRSIPTPAAWRASLRWSRRRRVTLALELGRRRRGRPCGRACAPSASQRTHFWPSAVQTRPKCIGLPRTVPLLRISQVPSARLE